jgi:ATP-dependent exoDNAse (exonuclease V) beta subunit
MLSILNAHPRDRRISFEEKNHVYSIDSRTGYTSVTTFIKKHFNEFDADKVLERMVRFGVFSKKYGDDKTPQDIKEEWKLLGRVAAERGTRLHRYIELFYNAQDLGLVDVSDLQEEVTYFYDFHHQLETTAPYRTEWYIFDEELKIAGSIDMVFKVGSGFQIFDWKCSKEIKRRNKYEKARAPLVEMDDCNYNHYSLQLNLYKFILEKNYGLQITGMNLVILHRAHPAFEVIPVPDLQREIRLMVCSRG